VGSKVIAGVEQSIPREAKHILYIIRRLWHLSHASSTSTVWGVDLKQWEPDYSTLCFREKRVTSRWVVASGVSPLHNRPANSTGKASRLQRTAGWPILIGSEF